MNCKQGERAMIVRLHPDFTAFERRAVQAAMGRVVVCQRAGNLDGCQVWYFEEPVVVLGVSGIPGTTVALLGAPDEILMPLRDPGDDAVDEVLLRVGKPEGVTA